jgi:hypothetical protein
MSGEYGRSGFATADSRDVDSNGLFAVSDSWPGVDIDIKWQILNETGA